MADLVVKLRSISLICTIFLFDHYYITQNLCNILCNISVNIASCNIFSTLGFTFSFRAYFFVWQSLLIKYSILGTLHRVLQNILQTIRTVIVYIKILHLGLSVTFSITSPIIFLYNIFPLKIYLFPFEFISWLVGLVIKYSIVRLLRRMLQMILTEDFR